MALIQLSYMSKALFRTVPVMVILPTDKISDETMDYKMKAGDTFPTLYLLHGLIGNYTDWVSGTRIQRWAEEKNLAVVMPSGENAFYVQGQSAWSDYGTFIGEELVEITRNMFPLSRRREDTFIAGLSMGGFGAIRNGLKYSNTFSHVAGLSPALHLFEQDDPDIRDNRIFGDLREASSTDKNPRVALNNLLEQNRRLPAFYLSCGLSDDLLPYSRLYRDLLISAGAEVAYEEEPGGHEWDFWDRQIRKVLDWLPLDDTSSGISSGHVKV